MRLPRSRTLIILLSLLAVGAAATGALALATALAPNPNEVCSGIPRDMGGCDQPQPTFSGETCSDVGRQFGSHVNARGLAIIEGPASLGGESQSVRLNEVVILVTSRANQYLRDNGMTTDCGVDEFVTGAETQFSEAFKARVGDYLYDGTTRPYSEWLENLRRTVRVIDMGEDEPFLPPSLGA